jgi:ATP-dependent DNA helicase RecQ
VNQAFLRKSGEYNVLQLTEAGWKVLRGEQSPRLLKPPQRKEKQRQSRAAAESWEGVDRDLFERLRAYRRRKAEERGVPPFIIFSDATLRDLARVRPTTLDQLPSIHGIGAKKCAEYGADLLAEVNAYCAK